MSFTSDFKERDGEMFKFVAQHRFLKMQDIISDRDFDDYDLREWEIFPISCLDKHPLCVIKVVNSELKERFFPIYNTNDLSKISISTSGHLIEPSQLSTEQRIWLQTEKEGQEIFS